MNSPIRAVPCEHQHDSACASELGLPCATAQAYIRHRRFSPTTHSFETTLNYLWFDPENLAQLCGRSRWWSHNRWNSLSIDDRDFLPQRGGSIRQKVALQLQSQQLTLDTDDQLRVLALPRSFGVGFNSVVFYVVLRAGKPHYILSEITNTPWKQRHTYIHQCAGQQQQRMTESYQFVFDKAFHVSPFMPMNICYHWNFRFKNGDHIIEMRLMQDTRMLFDASLRFGLHAITNPRQQRQYALGFPLQGLSMLRQIYQQALRLWLKKTPFHPHPHKLQQGEKHHEI